MEFERKHISLEVKEVSEDGTIEGYGSVFGVKDAYGDIVEPGAFSASMATGRKVKMLWQHRADEPVGVWDEMREDGKGLYMKGRLAMSVPRAKAIYDLLKMGALDGLSIGYRTMDKEDKAGSRHLKSVELHEVSFVTFPANEAATVTGVKSITAREVERDLREAGYSRSQAKAIALKGVSGLREADEEARTDALAAALRAFSETARQGR
jgi:uncharacterized protein